MALIKSSAMDHEDKLQYKTINIKKHVRRTYHDSVTMRRRSR